MFVALGRRLSAELQFQEKLIELTVRSPLPPFVTRSVVLSLTVVFMGSLVASIHELLYSWAGCVGCCARKRRSWTVDLDLFIALILLIKF